MADSELTRRAQALFLTEENTYGCAETALIVLQEHFSLPDPTDSSPAMALNGGVAYSGGPCGAITGAAMAVGHLASRRITDHRDAKGAARRITQRLMRDFTEEFGSTGCRELTGYDMATEHEAFLESGVWKDACMRQISYAVTRLAPLADPARWDAELQDLEAPPQSDGG
jgi:C_GCAxxG_C_C family probable redox protein